MYACIPESEPGYSRGCAHPAMQPPIPTTHSHPATERYRSPANGTPARNGLLAARPFAWKFTRHDLQRLLTRLAEHGPLSSTSVVAALAGEASKKIRMGPLRERMERGALWQENGLVFPSTVGTPLSGGNLNRTFKATLQRAGLPKSTRFHDLRHTCATLLLRQGVNPKFVQELLGHADISLTLNVYSHVLPDMGDAAAGAMDAALG
jgi:Phage integrase family